MNVQIKPLLKIDAPMVPKLIKSGMDQQLYPLTIFSSSGYSMYIKHILEIPEPLQTVKFYGAYKDNLLVGYVEWRIYQDQIFLNNISILPLYQSLGIGKLLVEVGFDLLKKFNKDKISLDVFDHNSKAKKWYERLGFVEEKQNFWYVREQGQMKSNQINSQNWHLENYSSSEAEHQIYGFSMLTLSNDFEKHYVGRIQERVYRINNIRTLWNEELIHLLYKLDSKRDLLLLTDSSSVENFNLAGVSTRMSLEAI